MKYESAGLGKHSVEAFDIKNPLPADRLLSHLGYVHIAFKGKIYTLRQTRNDKLILTKCGIKD